MQRGQQTTRRSDEIKGAQSVFATLASNDIDQVLVSLAQRLDAAVIEPQVRDFATADLPTGKLNVNSVS
jgi:hypothetical protein